MLLGKKKYGLRALGSDLVELLRRFWILLSYLGAAGLWTGTITAALTGKVPDGVTAWMTAGVWMLLYQEWQLRKAIKNAEPGVEYWRRVAIMWSVRLHIICNLFVIVVLWRRIISTHQQLSNLDQLSLSICVVCLTATFVAVKLFGISRPIALFLYAVFSRVIEQAAVAFSPTVAKLPPATVYGLLVVASVIAINMGLELGAASRAYRKNAKKRTRQAKRALSWAFGSAALNEAAAGLVNVSWQLAR
jgi:hypothetical protein